MTFAAWSSSARPAGVNSAAQRYAPRERSAFSGSYMNAPGILSAESSDAIHRDVAASSNIDSPFDALSTSLESEGFSNITAPCKHRSCSQS
ncbi:hypothetical protein WI40_01610 [Burkholderia ubonensis]|nr:hypothetical protein WI40_01610 [Burkholderia ubonensis]